MRRRPDRRTPSATRAGRAAGVNSHQPHGSGLTDNNTRMIDGDASSGCEQPAGDVEIRVSQDMEFHQLLARASGNPVFEMILSTLPAATDPHAAHELWTPTGRFCAPLPPAPRPLPQRRCGSTWSRLRACCTLSNLTSRMLSRQRRHRPELGSPRVEPENGDASASLRGLTRSRRRSILRLRG